MTTARTLALAFGPWCAGFAIGYLLVAIPVAGVLVLLGMVAAGAWRAVGARRRRMRLPGWYLVVWALLTISTLLGLVGGAGQAAHGSQSPWAGLIAAALAWVVARAASSLEEAR